MDKLTYIDLFAGAGGLSEGFVRKGFIPVAHVEMDQAACFTLKTRAAYKYLKDNNQNNDYVSYLKGKISRAELYSLVPSELLESVINLPIGEEFNETIHRVIKKQLQGQKVDLIIGGPPCQAYSIVGRARSENKMKGDPRNYLYVQYGKYLDKYKPKMFVFENVMGLKSAKGGFYLENMELLFGKKGYKMQLFTVEADKFGVLQNRKRIIILGWRKEFTANIPDLDKIDLSNDFKVGSIFSDLPFLNGGQGTDKYQQYQKTPCKYINDKQIRNGVNVITQHIARSNTKQDKEIYRIVVNKWDNEKKRLDYNDLPDRLKTHQNRHSFFDRFKVVAKELPYSQTVVAHISKDGHYYIHPDIEQNRSITVREAARLQSFPDDYYFEGVKEDAFQTPAFRQIGNAVPPLMAEEIASIIKRILRKGEPLLLK